MWILLFLCTGKNRKSCLFGWTITLFLTLIMAIVHKVGPITITRTLHWKRKHKSFWVECLKSIILCMHQSEGWISNIIIKRCKDQLLKFGYIKQPLICPNANLVLYLPDVFSHTCPWWWLQRQVAFFHASNQSPAEHVMCSWTPEEEGWGGGWYRKKKHHELLLIYLKLSWQKLRCQRVNRMVKDIYIFFNLIYIKTIIW